MRPQWNPDLRPLALALLTFYFGSPAFAACCNVVKSSATPPETALRICEMALTGACRSVLFEGTLATGASVNVCTETDAIVYDVPDGAGGYGEPTGAVCDGSADVEL